MIMRRDARLCAILCALVVVTACSETTSLPTGTSSVIVHAVLDVGSRDQFVLLERTRAGQGVPTDNRVFQHAERPILGARVTITSPNGLVMVAHETHLTDSTSIRGLYRLSLDEYGVTLSQGERYTLHVMTDVGEEISGLTTIPGGTAALPTPPESFRRDVDTLRLNWPRVPGARSYEVRLQSNNPDYPYIVDDPYIVFADSSVRIAGLARSLSNAAIFFPQTNVTAVVSAVDDNYYEYYRAISDPFLGIPAGHLAGAVGVFGSMVPLIVRRLAVQ